jgi:hypothetical protein
VRRCCVLKGFLLASIVLFALQASLEAQQTPSDQEQQFHQLQKRYEAEHDPTAKEALGYEIDKREQEIDRQRIAELPDRWTKETDAKRRKEIGEELARW